MCAPRKHLRREYLYRKFYLVAVPDSIFLRTLSTCDNYPSWFTSSKVRIDSNFQNRILTPRVILNIKKVRDHVQIDFYVKREIIGTVRWDLLKIIVAEIIVRNDKADEILDTYKYRFLRSLYYFLVPRKQITYEELHSIFSCIYFNKQNFDQLSSFSQTVRFLLFSNRLTLFD